MRLLSTLDSLASKGKVGASPAESVSQTQPKTGAGLASCDVTTRIERLGGFGACRKARVRLARPLPRRLVLHDIRYFQRLLRHSGGSLRDSRASPEAISMSPGSD